MAEVNHLVAWAPNPQPHLSPSEKDSAIILSAVWVREGNRVTVPNYLHHLGERIQKLVDSSSDPQAATNMLMEDLFQAGLLPDVGHVPAMTAGAHLVASDPGTRERLANWVDLENGHPGPNPSPAAKEALNDDRYDPEDRLRVWASLLSRLPHDRFTQR